MSTVTSVTMSTVKPQIRSPTHAWSSSVAKTVAPLFICASKRSTSISVLMKQSPALMPTMAVLSPCTATDWANTWRSVLPVWCAALRSGIAGLFQKQIRPSTEICQKTPKPSCTSMLLWLSGTKRCCFDPSKCSTSFLSL